MLYCAVVNCTVTQARDAITQCYHARCTGHRGSRELALRFVVDHLQASVLARCGAQSDTRDQTFAPAHLTGETDMRKILLVLVAEETTVRIPLAPAFGIADPDKPGVYRAHIGYHKAPEACGACADRLEVSVWLAHCFAGLPALVNRVNAGHSFTLARPRGHRLARGTHEVKRG